MTSLPIAGPNPFAVYTGRTTSWPMVAATGAGAVLLALTSRQSSVAWDDPMVIVPLVLIAIGVVAEILTGSSVRATAGPNGLTIHWGLLGWPRCTYRLDQIERAEMIDLPWWRVSYGFWWTPKRTNCTVRSGPTLRISLRNGRTVTITVPDPTAAVAALQHTTN
jgi:hypothetical protein